jgi:dienelactone hydrolase
MTDTRSELRRFLQLRDPHGVTHFEVESVESEPTHARWRIHYPSRDGEAIPAFLLVPQGLSAPTAAVLLHHQHAGQRHFGKSEVCGLVGDPLQAFGPSLAARGIIVLAPDSICFEDRRTGRTGTEPHESDWQQHYNEMSYRLLRGDILLRKVLEDAEVALSVLAGLPSVDCARLGIAGHSYGGNTVLFQAALDERVRYACTSGALCSFRTKMQHGTGIELSLAVPGLLARLDVDDLVRCCAPRPLLVVSATEDEYARDAPELVRLAAPSYAALSASAALELAHYEGGHALTPARFERIVTWLQERAAL